VSTVCALPIKYDAREGHFTASSGDFTSIGLQHKNLNNYVFRIVSLLIQSSRNGARLDCTYVWAVANEMVAHEVCLSKSYKDATTANRGPVVGRCLY